MPRYRTRSWRALDEGALAKRPAELRPAPVANLRILGLDPGSRRTGFGVIECRGSDYKHVAHGCIAVAGLELAERLRRIFEALSALITEHGPWEIEVERGFVNRNMVSALKLGQARGAALCAIPKGFPDF